jgi:uncharacterized protein
MEQRSEFNEIRAADEGIVEGYASVWGVVDSYNSAFQRGAFTKTLQERGSRIKVLWNHGEEVIGVPVELREDDRGLFVRAQLLMNVQRGREVFELIKASAIDTFSIGFKTIKDKWVGGVRQITEAALYEFSPVIFEANSAAVITGVRNMDQRAQDYAKTFGQYELSQRHRVMVNALDQTLMDIWWERTDPETTKKTVTEALTAFTSHYSIYMDELLAMATEQRSLPATNDITQATRNHLQAAEVTPEQFAATTEFTLDEVRSLLMGSPEVAPEKVRRLPEAIRAAVAKHRAERVEALCAELRHGLDEAEKERITGLLNPQPDAVESMVVYMEQFRNTLRG